MDTPSRQVQITLSRIGKPARVFWEGLLGDDGRVLRTLSIPSSVDRLLLSEKFRGHQWLSDQDSIYSVRKYFFYNEHFDIIEFRDSAFRLLGYYCDIVTLLHRHESMYELTDLVLDYWIGQDNWLCELDREEYDDLLSAGQISSDNNLSVQKTISKIETEWKAGSFPSKYIGE